ncbi:MULTISPECIES: ABC transporter ATP-binding protein [Gordonia]|uniref:ATP-binding cassette domain-containing protein n=1 Tax=Gordonia amicalis TaxID=89053 RepID=A0AAE4UAY5_9ACTN|nr:MULTISPECIES: ATP-binding cassette domain-containing protein [Gordonia]ATD72533.1 ABC transporter [Gordonia sp. 1D]MCR8897936.1 ATP-binding cassette domain-containing protein [Gordonia sp. GONU]MCZ0915116.1 ATP-binding cassette domain-containing protein [Gordonia amicalis]MCZ4578516.1 ATP-binding cassette domain-containing protein [Gordonia amicalis]MCZ4653323.1 ATP-binding cassette domain-containing protein [Gordonia amicalis]
MTATLLGHGLTARFGSREVFTGVDVSVDAGSVLGIVGQSGSGKTTLLRILAGLTAPAAGTVEQRGVELRPGTIGLIAQHPRLVTNPRWTLRRIVAEPATIARRNCDIEAVAGRVGLDPALLDRFPSQVSDGQLQRACVGRLLVQAPRFVLCDEPTAMLDPLSARAVIGLLQALVDDGAGMVLVSHQRRLVDARCRDVVDLDVR